MYVLGKNSKQDYDIERGNNLYAQLPSDKIELIFLCCWNLINRNLLCSLESHSKMHTHTRSDDMR